MRRATLTALLTVMSLLLATDSGAITYGELDGSLHPTVGALIRVRPSDGAFRILCSGTLIDEDLVLTAAHCTDFLASQGVTDLWVSFDSEIDPDNPETAARIHATYVTHPDYAFPNNDVALVFLDQPVATTPATIIEENGLATMKTAGTLRGQTFTNVGYGSTSEWQFGPPVLEFDGKRRFSTSPYRGLTKNSLILLMTHNATGQGGTCSGDSGGPHFVGNSLVIASVTSWGDPLCRSLDQTQRVDIPSVHDFIEQYLD